MEILQIELKLHRCLLNACKNETVRKSSLNEDSGLHQDVGMDRKLGCAIRNGHV